MSDTAASSRGKHWLAVGIPVAVGLLIVGYALYRQGEGPGLQLQQIPREDAVEELPAGLPFDPDGTILENFAANDGRSTQFTRVYATDESLAAHREAYEAYFEKNGWRIVDEDGSDERGVLFAQKDLLQLLVAFDRVVAPSVTTVNVTLLQAPAAPVAP